MRSGQADALDGILIELSGWMIPLEDTPRVDYFLLVADAPCCGGCAPADPLSSIEVLSASPVQLQSGPVTIRGRLRRLVDDPAGWRYQLISAYMTSQDRTISRRTFLASTAALSLSACARGRFAGYTDEQDTPAIDKTWRPDGMLTMDMHSHAGRVTISRDPAIGANRPFVPLAAPMPAWARTCSALSRHRFSPTTASCPTSQVNSSPRDFRTKKRGRFLGRITGGCLRRASGRGWKYSTNAKERSSALV
jgi:membrane dipeptidase